MNIIDSIIFQCRMNPDAPAICAPGTALHAIKYGLLERCIYNVGRTAQAFGLEPGKIVAILVRDKIFHAALILGLTRVGIVTVSARSPRLPKEIGIDAIISDSAGPFANVGRIIQADIRWLQDDGSANKAEPAVRGGEADICRIVLTSGTTGEAKAIALSHRNLIGRLARYEYIKGNRFPGVSRLYCEPGLTTSPGFRYLIYMLSRGGTIFFFGEDPDSTAQAFDLYKVQAMVASPAGLAEWVQYYETTRVFQANLDHILSTGGLLPRALSERVRARMSANLFCTYGASETGTVCVGPAHLIADMDGAVGFVTPDASVEVVDAADTILPRGREGMIRVRTPQSVDHYLGDPERSKEAFRKGWFYPGDTGHLTPDGMLVVRGREESVFNLSGDKIRPEVVEDAIMSFPGIRQAAAFIQKNDLGIAELWGAVVAGGPLEEAALSKHCVEKLGRAFAPVHYVKVDALPRNDMGKLERHRLPELLGRAVG